MFKRLCYPLVRLAVLPIMTFLKRFCRVFGPQERPISSSFIRLEPRRVLSVNGTFAAGTLTVDISAGGNTDATLMIDPGDANSFFLDENANALRDGTEDGGLLTQLRSLQVNGPSGPLDSPLGRFFWTGNFAAASNLETVNVNQVLEVSSTATIETDAGVILRARDSIDLGGQLTVAGDLRATTTDPAGSITSVGTANIIVLGNARFESNEINIGQIAGDSIQFGSITAVSTGTALISEDSNVLGPSPGMQWTGASQLGSATINSSADLTFATGSSLSFSGLVDVDASDNIEVNGAIAGTGSGSLDLAGDSISMSNASTIDLDSGTVRMTSVVGDIVVSSVETNNTTASAIQLQSAQSILDGTSGEQADLRAANGTIQLTATSGNIGTSLNDLNINAASLVFNATTGNVHITDIFDGLIISGVSTAGAGGVIQARSPLTIAANVTVGATTSFIAGNSSTAGDNLTIQSGAIVTLNSAVAGSLTFIAGDDIRITSGRITTTGNTGHNVILTADNEGVADADRGSVTGDGTAALDVVAANLVVNSADGINLDVNVDSLTLSNTFANAIDIRENDNLSLISATNSNGSIQIVANGNMQVQNVLAQGAANDVNLRMLVATIDGQVRSTGGSVFVESLGSLITMNATGELIANVGSVKMQATAAGADIVADSITAGRDILVRAGDDITLNGPITSDTGANAALFDGHIEINAGDTLTSSVAVTAVDGSVFVRGTNVDLLDGGDLNSNLGLYVEAGGSISIASDINAQQAVLIRNGAFTVTATGSVVGANIAIQSSSFSLAGTIDAAAGVAVAAGSITMTGNALIDGTSVAMFANGNIALGRVVATNTNIFSDSGSITDNNGAALNVQASTLSMTALLGSIGASDLPGTPDLNPNAIDIQVGTLSSNARNGMYFQQSTGNLTIGSASGVGAGASPVFFRVPFIGPATTGFGNFGLSIGGSSDLIASGPIKVKVDAGTLTITDGFGGNGIGVTTSSGDILLWGENGVNVQARVVATNGDITFRSNGTVGITASGSLQAGDTGLILANSLNSTGTISAANGLIIQAVGEVTVGGTVSSRNGSIALISAAGSVNQNSSVITIADYYVSAAADFNMAAGVSINATGNAIVRAANNLNLRLVQANNVALVAANIIDADSDEAVNIVANNAVVNATNSIGSSNLNPNPDSNINAIDLDVDTISTRSGVGGTYLKQAVVGGSIAIGPVSQFSVNFAIKESKFNSSGPTFSLGVQSTTSTAQENAESAGVFKLVTENGRITVNDGSDADSLGIDTSSDILLDSRNRAAIGSDVVINSGVSSVSGHVTLNAADDVLVHATVSTGGSGTIYINAGNNALDVVGLQVNGVNVDAALTTVNGDILINSAEDIRQNALVSSTSGDIGLIAARNVVQTTIGHITTTSGDTLVEANNGNWTMDANTNVQVGGGDFLGRASGDITLGQISMTNVTTNRVALQATTGSIIDANAEHINIEEIVGGSNTSLSLRAGQRVGNAGGTFSDTNDQAIDINVDTVAATSASGIYLREVAAGGSLTVDTVSAVTVDVDGVRRSRFDSSTTDAAQVRTATALYDLTTTIDGSVKVVTENGSLNINGGSDTIGVTANGKGAILLEARNAFPLTGGDVIINASVSSGSGHVTLNAADDVQVNAAVATGGVGTLYINASNNTNDAAGPQVDGANINAALTTASGDILVNSAQDILQDALISSTSGDIGLIAARNIVQTEAGDITTTSGDALVEAESGDWTMTSDTVVSIGGGDFYGRANGDITLGQISMTNGVANRTALQATAGSIIDANTAKINIEETIVGATTSLSLRAGQRIGNAAGTTSDTNDQAIDLNVDTVAASSASGIYLREVAAGGSLIVDTVSAVTVNVDGVRRSHFDSSTTDAAQVRNLTALEDLTTTNNGPVKVVTENGTLTVNSGVNAVGVSANGTGDVLLETRAVGNDIVVNASVSSGSGHVTLNATDDAIVNATVSTGGAGTLYINASSSIVDAVGPQVDGVNINAALTTASGDILINSAQDIRQDSLISSVNGDIGLIAARNIAQTAAADVTTTSGDALVEAESGDWTMAGDTIIGVGGGDFYGRSNGDITLGQISMTNASANRIALQATNGSIIDANAAIVNIEETVAGSNTTLSLRAGQRIGEAGGGASAVDLNVDTVAATAASGIYLREVAAGESLTVDTVSAVRVIVDGVRRSHFDSSDTAILQTRDLAGLDDLTTTNNGTISVVTENGGLTINGGVDTTGVSANGTGDVVLVSQNQAANGADILVNASIRSDVGGITITAADDIHTNSEISNNGVGNIAINAGNNQSDATLAVNDGVSFGSSVTTTNGNISIVSQGDIETTNGRVLLAGIGLTVNSAGYTHLSNTRVASLAASVGGVGGLDGAFEQTNANADNKGDDFFMGMNPRNAAKGNLLPTQSGTDFEDNAKAAGADYRFQNRTAERYALFVKNSEDLTVRSITATSATAPHVYVETTNARNLTVSGIVATVNTQINNVGRGVEGLTIFVAGGEFELTGQGNLVTVANFAGGVRTQIINQIGPDGDYVLVTGYNGGEGTANGVQPVSTRIVNPDIFGSNSLDNDPEIDAYQRVILNYGASREFGFDVYIAYADGVLQRFNRISDLGVVDDKTFDPSNRVPDENSYAAAPLGSPANTFTRTTLMSQQFIIDNSSLPTVVSVRRADDFFIFENASATDASLMRDLTVETVEILDVVSITAEMKALPLPEDVPNVIPAVILVDSKADEFINVILPNSGVEPKEIVERRIEIDIYQVFFEDKNNDGYADEDELPTDSEIIDFAIIEENDSNEKKQLEPKTRMKKGSISSASGSITNQEIESIKAKLLKNPNQPTGAYAIIKKDALNNEKVLEVFPVRDSQESTPINQEESPLIQRKVTPSKTEEAPDETDTSASEERDTLPNAKQPQPDSLSQMNAVPGAGLLAGALWLTQHKRMDANQTLESVGTAIGNANRLNRSARRARRIASIIDRTTSNS